MGKTDFIVWLDSQDPTFSFPVLLPTTIALILAAFVLIANRHRSINRVMAIALFASAVWNGAILFYKFQPRLSVEVIIFSGGLTIGLFSLLKDMIAAPWRSVWGCVRKIWLQCFLVSLFGLAFTPLVVPTGYAVTYHPRGPLYGVLETIAAVWPVYVFGDAMRIIGKDETNPIVANELVALIIVSVSAWSSFLIRLWARYHQGSIAMFLRPSTSLIFALGLVLVSILTVRKKILDYLDIWNAVVSIAIWAGSIIVIAFVAVKLAPAIGIVSFVNALVWSLLVVIVVFGIWSIDTFVRRFLKKRSVSARFIECQASLRLIAEQAFELSSAQARFADVLQRWSDGSSAVFLSTGTISGKWPPPPMPEALIASIDGAMWITPETLERDRRNPDPGLKYMIEHRVAAFVCCKAENGDKLISAFRERTSQRPFISRELREAYELMQMIQINYAAARLRQKIRSTDRLGFYAQYAPQFAHEIRNGLFVQAQLLRAVVDGRAGEIGVSDAESGLARIEQVERLCEHFFSMGNLFNRSSSIETVDELLLSIVEQARAQFAVNKSIQIILTTATVSGAQFVVNRDLLQMAILNLIKNGIEAQDSHAATRIVELNISSYMDAVRILVYDKGCGLPDDRIRDVFSPGRSSKRDGLGLGLSIVRDCIEAMGGSIGVRSSTRDGTCFEISLNVAKEDSPVAPLHRGNGWLNWRT